jgi:hypothetical protein
VLPPFLWGPSAFAVLSFCLKLPKIFRSASSDFLAPFPTQLNGRRVLLPGHRSLRKDLPASDLRLKQNTVLLAEEEPTCNRSICNRAPLASSGVPAAMLQFITRNFVTAVIVAGIEQSMIDVQKLSDARLGISAWRIFPSNDRRFVKLCRGLSL